MPSTAVKPVLANTLNRSGMPKYARGRTPVPTALAIMRHSAASAHLPSAGQAFCRSPPKGDERQGGDGQQHHCRRDDQVHHILKLSRTSGLRQREHGIAHGGNPVHQGEQINARPQN